MPTTPPLLPLCKTLQTLTDPLPQIPPLQTLQILTLTHPPLQTLHQKTLQTLHKTLHTLLQSTTTPKKITEDNIFEAIKEFNDVVLDWGNMEVDKLAGINAGDVDRVNVNVVVGERGGKKKEGVMTMEALSEMFEKPQRFFEDAVDNSERVFVPRCFDGKEGGNMEGEEEEGEEGDGDGVVVDSHLERLYQRNASIRSRHPYEGEIVEGCERMCRVGFEEEDTEVFLEVDNWGLVYVDSYEGLCEMCGKLLDCKEIGVDIEHHSYRSYLGFVCLLQISTRREDFIVDALKLRKFIPKVLGKVFMNGDIVKVLHGAKHDVEWLERCFSLYLFPLFDTGQAAALLKYPSRSLAFLLKRFANVDSPDKKKFQMADWRIRPIPQDMMDYARSDTHYLLYIYDRLRTELLAKKKRDTVAGKDEKKDEEKRGAISVSETKKGWALKKAWKLSANVARRRFTKPRVVDDGIGPHIARKFNLKWSDEDIAVANALCKWRDAEARKRDESWMYIMSSRSLINIVAGRKATGKIVTEEMEKIQKIVGETRKEAKEKRKAAPKVVVPVKAVKESEHVVFSDYESDDDSEFDMDPTDGVDMDAKYGVELPKDQVKVELKSSSALGLNSESSSADEDEGDEKDTDSRYGDEKVEVVGEMEVGAKQNVAYKGLKINKQSTKDEVEASFHADNDLSPVTEEDDEDDANRMGRKLDKNPIVKKKVVLPSKRTCASPMVAVLPVKMAKMSALFDESNSDSESDCKDGRESSAQMAGSDNDGRQTVEKVLKCISHKGFGTRQASTEAHTGSVKIIEPKEDNERNGESEGKKPNEIKEVDDGERNDGKDNNEGEFISLNERYGVGMQSKRSKKKKAKKSRDKSKGDEEVMIAPYDFEADPYIPKVTKSKGKKKKSAWYDPFDSGNKVKKGLGKGEGEKRERRIESGVTGNRSMTYRVTNKAGKK